MYKRIRTPVRGAGQDVRLLTDPVDPVDAVVRLTPSCSVDQTCSLHNRGGTGVGPAGTSRCSHEWITVQVIQSWAAASEKNVLQLG